MVNYIREAQIAAGVPRAQVYDYTMYILAGFLVLSFIANALVKPVDRKWFMTEEDGPVATVATPTGNRSDVGTGGLDVKVLLAWLAVGIPIQFGVYQTLQSVVKLFQ